MGPGLTAAGQLQLQATAAPLGPATTTRVARRSGPLGFGRGLPPTSCWPKTPLGGGVREGRWGGGSGRGEGGGSGRGEGGGVWMDGWMEQQRPETSLMHLMYKHALSTPQQVHAVLLGVLDRAPSTVGGD